MAEVGSNTSIVPVCSCDFTPDHSVVFPTLFASTINVSNTFTKIILGRSGILYSFHTEKGDIWVLVSLATFEANMHSLGIKA
jgi:hypothetical protein